MKHRKHFPQMRNDNVLVLLDHHVETERKTAGGIHIPQQHRPEVVEGVWGTVLTSGPGFHPKCKTEDRVGRRLFVRNETRPGDRVIVDGPHVGQPWFHGGIEYRIVRESEILAVQECEN